MDNLERAKWIHRACRDALVALQKEWSPVKCGDDEINELYNKIEDDIIVAELEAAYIVDRLSENRR